MRGLKENARSGKFGHRGNRGGFTLIEVLLAVGLGALMLTAITFTIYSMAALWGYGQNERLFGKHTRGVSRFLEHSFQSASGRYSEEESSSPIFWMDWEGDDTELEQFLSFELETSPGAFVWPIEPLPHVVCSLDFDPDEGLFVLWRSRLEEEFEEAPPRRTLVSPFVRDLRYHYIDYEVENPQWEVTQEPKREADRSYLLPQRVELVFELKGETVTRQLAIPEALAGVPVF